MKQVMIVEDQKMIRSMLESYIEKEPGYQVAVSIAGANQAPGLCDTMGIDLILMDVQTEHRENGLSAVEKIKARQKGRQNRGGHISAGPRGARPGEGRRSRQPLV